MTGSQSFIARGALACAASAATCAVLYYKSGFKTEERRFDKLFLLLFAVSRFGLFSVIFLVAHIAPRGDVPGIYVPEALLRLHGGIPYLSFQSSYAPLHSYLDAFIYSVVPGSLGLIFLAIAAEIAALYFWIKIGRAVLTDTQVRIAAVLYFFSPVSLQFVSIDGQNNAIISLFLALSIFLLLRRQDVLSGVAFGLSICVVKFLPLVWLPAFLLYNPRRFRWLLGAAIPVFLVYGYFGLVLHAPLLVPFTAEGGMKSAGTLSYLIESIAGHDFGSHIWDLLLLAVLGCTVLRDILVSRKLREGLSLHVQALTLSLPLYLIVLMALAKKSWPTYAVIILFPLAVLIAKAMEDTDHRRRLLVLAGFIVFGITAVLEHSYWATFTSQADALSFHGKLLVAQPVAWTGLAWEICMLSSYAFLAWICVKNRPEENTVATRSFGPRIPVER
jgi:hypothetical protein